MPVRLGLSHSPFKRDDLTLCGVEVLLKVIPLPGLIPAPGLCDVLLHGGSV